MAKQLTVKDPTTGKVYTLEFTRDTVAQMEKGGFVAQELGEKSMLMLPMLWSGAFLAHHKWVKPEVVENIYNKMPDKKGLLNALVQMVEEPYDTLMAEPEEESEGNMEWETNW